MRSIRPILFASLACVVAACSASGSSVGFDNVDGGDSGGVGDDGGIGIIGDGGTSDVAPTVETIIYAHSATELFSMSPVSKKVVSIGTFDDGSGKAPDITDLAINKSGDIWVNSETGIYQATLPPSGQAGKVALTAKVTLPQDSRFFALGFTPEGTLQAGESLVAGDGNGDLFFIDTASASAVPQRLGDFGAVLRGEPADATKYDVWALSGDVVFYTSNGQPIGLATLHACRVSNTGVTSGCDSSNDILAEIDIAQLKSAYNSKTASKKLKKRILGTGTGYGRLFGVGAWGDNVYAFSSSTAGTSPQPAQLIEINGSGLGGSIASFPEITKGWYGAGVSTTAVITVVK